MTLFKQSQCAMCFGIVSIVLAIPVSAVGITGLAPGLPFQADNAIVLFDNNQLVIPANNNHNAIKITPWPDFLPQRFARQHITGNRRISPAGPSDQLTLTQSGSKSPWLMLAAGATPASPTIGEWRLQLNGTTWSVQLPEQTTITLSTRPSLIPYQQQRWCLSILDSTLPAPAAAGVAMETEARLMWVAVRLSNRQKHCSK